MKMCIKGIEIQAVIGTMHHERSSHQSIYVDIEFHYAAKKASETDKLDYAVDYYKLVEDIIATTKKSRYYLIETLAERIAALLKENPLIHSGSVTVKKPSALKNIDFVSAEANF